MIIIVYVVVLFEGWHVAPKLFVRMLSWRDGTTEAAIVVRFSRAIVYMSWDSRDWPEKSLFSDALDASCC